MIWGFFLGWLEGWWCHWHKKEIEEEDYSWLGSEVVSLSLDTLNVPSNGDVQWIDRIPDLALGKEVWAVVSIWRLTVSSWPLNSMGLNCAGPLICEFLKINTYYSTQDSCLVEFQDVEPRIQKADCKVVPGFSIAQGVGALTPALFKGHLYIFW